MHSRRLRPLLYTVVALIFSVLISSKGFAKSSSCSGASGNAAITVFDTDSSNNLLLMRSDDHNGSGQATYSTADANVSSSLYCGTYFLRLYSQQVRTVFVDANTPYGAEPAGPAAGYYWQYVELALSCLDSFGNAVPLNNVLTFSNNCRQSLDFGVNNVKYKMVLGPPSTGISVTTGLVTVTCKTVTNNNCVSWAVTPYTGGAPANPPGVGDLDYYASGGKLKFIGQYYFTFNYQITMP
jgi:hypothetical protein